MKFSRLSILLIGIALIAVIASSQIVQAQGRGGGRRGGERGGPQGRSGFQGRGFGGGFGGSNPLSLVLRPEIQKELGLTESQVKDLQALAENQRNQGAGNFRDRFSGIQNASQEEREKLFAEIREERTKQSEKTREGINDILSRSQGTRFAQLELQSALRRPGVVNALKSLNIKISDEEKLTETERGVREELQKTIAKLQQQATQDILQSVFGSREISKMLGEPFDFETGRRGAREGGRARGGREGARGGERTRGTERGGRTQGRATRTRTRPAREEN